MNSLFKLTLSKETFDMVFTRFLMAMGYIDARATLDLTTLRFDAEEGSVYIEGNLKEEAVN